MKTNDTMQFIIIPIVDGVSVDAIPSDIKEAACKSMEFWELYFENENRKRKEELEGEIRRLEYEKMQASLMQAQFGCGFPVYIDKMNLL